MMACQVWALGCVLYSLLVGKLPFDGEDKVEQVYNILNKELKFPSRIKRDPDLLDLLTRMLDRNPRHRITVDEALRHPWVRCISLSVLPDRASVSSARVYVWALVNVCASAGDCCRKIEGQKQTMMNAFVEHETCAGDVLHVLKAVIFLISK
jgi:serine/threonine protein kinase